jgi:glycosyltransferase involved in cell wall biosynthesis
MTPLVSVIMPAWRPRPDWLHEAVASVLADDGCPLELVVVDDGSPEPVADLLADVHDPRLRVVRSPHVGPYAVRNLGLAAARGTHVRFFDADDIAEPGSTSRLLARIDGREDRIAYGATLETDELLRPGALIDTHQEGDVTQACVLGAFDVRVVSLLFPRVVLERGGGWDDAFPVSGDWDFVLRALEQAPVVRVDAVVTRYRRHGASVTRTADVAAGARAGRMVLGRYFARHPGQRGTAFERRAYGRLHADRALAHAARGDVGRAVEELRRMARRDPVAGVRTAVTLLSGLAARGARRARRARRTRA